MGICIITVIFFLKADRSLRDDMASNFKAELIWECGEIIKKQLNEKTDKNEPERLRYLPQNFFERLTNNLNTYNFRQSLENLVLAYMLEEERLGKKNFVELINYRKQLIEEDSISISNEINKINDKIISLEKKEYPDYKKNLQDY